MLIQNNDNLLILNSILEAKENRADLRKKIAQQNFCSISFNLNVPGYPKTNHELTQFFEQVCEEINFWLMANRISFENQEYKIDDAGNFIIWKVTNKNFDAQELKFITEKFEEKHKLGRFLDLDVTNNLGQNVSSGKPKKCFFCQNFPAIVCMRERKHDFEEIRNFMFEEIKKYLNEIKKEKIIRKMSELAVKSLLYEVSFSPKPGLVDYNQNGSHSDMNYFTFLNSISALSPLFKQFSEIAFNFDSDFENILPKIREIGLQMEQVMFKATNNVNTQKGLIFLLGLSIFASSRLFYENKIFTNQNFREIIRKICFNITKNELVSTNNLNKTHGEICYHKFGNLGAGARWEAENGFPTVFEYGLTVLEQFLEKKFFNNKDKINFALEKTLLSIISANNDSNILYRKNDIILNEFKQLAKNILDEKLEYSEIIKYCEHHNISPGGSADLLAVSIFIYFVKQEINLI